MDKKNKGRNLTIIGIALMISLILTKLMGVSNLASYSLLVGLAFFFIIEWVTKTPEAESGLRFTSFFADLKRCGPFLWLIIPALSSLGSIILGSLLFDSRYVDHVVGRTDSILNFENIVILIGQFIIGAMGEEIAFRGFFVGKGMKIFGFWPTAIVSSACFALAHLASGDTAIVLFDLFGIFIDAVVYSLIMRKTNNCLISTVSHFLVNMLGVLAMQMFFR